MERVTFGSFAELTNARSVVPVLSTGRFDVSRKLFAAWVDDALGADGFDEKWYGVRYPDISKGIRDGVIQSGRWHYAQFGYFENRMPRRIDVDAEYYADKYPDIKSAIKDRRIESAQWHFDEIGFMEGRSPRADWSLFPPR